jgi:hypothetical protein
VTQHIINENISALGKPSFIKKGVNRLIYCSPTERLTYELG